MAFLILSVATVLLVWAVCSLAEAAIYAVRAPYVRHLAKVDNYAAQILSRFKQNMERPISAILIINTVVAAAGASIAGAQASEVFGPDKLWLFSAAFTIAALVFSEILPKTIGVAYNRTIARAVARPLSFAVLSLYPLVFLIERAAMLVKPSVPSATAPEAEVQTMAEISAEEGSIMRYEAELVRNVLDLDKVVAREIMTPKSVVTKLPNNLTLGELAKRPFEWTFSRIPIHAPEMENVWTGFVLSRDVLAAIARDHFSQSLNSLAKPLHFVSDTAPGHKLLRAFLVRRIHLFGVVDAKGDVVGIVTLEDVLESLIGTEIVDESDTVVDMQKLAMDRKKDLGKSDRKRN
ncbi:MAG: DUF21 domain-containing protein [Planctomycetales bacterium]|nr:DUF21 domain-containing protein [Planctomycetales bacterium]